VPFATAWGAEPGGAPLPGPAYEGILPQSGGVQPEPPPGLRPRCLTPSAPSLTFTSPVFTSVGDVLVVWGVLSGIGWKVGTVEGDVYEGVLGGGAFCLRTVPMSEVVLFPFVGLAVCALLNGVFVSSGGLR
jgi:hypothetical protein